MEITIKIGDIEKTVSLVADTPFANLFALGFVLNSAGESALSEAEQAYLANQLQVVNDECLWAIQGLGQMMASFSGMQNDNGEVYGVAEVGSLLKNLAAMMRQCRDYSGLLQWQKKGSQVLTQKPE